MTKKQEKAFIKFYMERYAKPWETTQECIDRLITEWIQADEEIEYSVWIEAIRAILWNNANKSYRWNTVSEKLCSVLWLNYWPKFIS